MGGRGAGFDDWVDGGGSRVVGWSFLRYIIPVVKEWRGSEPRYRIANPVLTV